jgi:membrane-associated protein
MEFLNQLVAIATHFVDVILHLDQHLNAWVGHFGPWIYVILFAIIFAETGLVIFPILPGDSLLFALGALTTVANPQLDLTTLMISLFVAAVLGDAVNYTIGKYFGPRIFKSETSWFLNKAHLLKTQAFYEKYGGKTIIFARFIPIVRTFAPFVAGIGSMNYSRFALFNVVGAVAWIGGFLVLGHFFGNLPFVKSNFHIVIFGIIILSLMPPIIEWVRARRGAAAQA